MVAHWGLAMQAQLAVQCRCMAPAPAQCAAPASHMMGPSHGAHLRRSAMHSLRRTLARIQSACFGCSRHSWPYLLDAWQGGARGGFGRQREAPGRLSAGCWQGAGTARHCQRAGQQLQMLQQQQAAAHRQAMADCTRRAQLRCNSYTRSAARAAVNAPLGVAGGGQRLKAGSKVGGQEVGAALRQAAHWCQPG